MKSLVLKDLFNIGHNAKSMLFILVVFAVALIPFSGVEGYIFVCAILCSMMIVTTFSFDDSSKWTRYAMIMPVSKKELVAGKFMVLAIFCAIGSLFGLIIGFIGGLITHKIVLDIVGIGELLFLTLGAWVISLIFGSMSIPLVFKFGAEKGRVLLLVSFLIPAGICFGIYQLLTIQPFDLVVEPIMKRCHNFCAGLLAHFQPAYTITDHRKYNFVPLRLSSLYQKERVLIRFFFPDIRIICGTKFHGSFPAFSAVFMFNFKKNRLFPFV